DAVDLDHADAAQAIGGAVVVVANGRDLPARPFCGFENRCSRRHGDGSAVDGESDIGHRSILWLTGTEIKRPELFYHDTKDPMHGVHESPCKNVASYLVALNISGHNFIALNIAIGAV